MRRSVSTMFFLVMVLTIQAALVQAQTSIFTHKGKTAGSGLALNSSQAAPGSLDTTFGTNGTVVTPVGANTSYAEAIAIQPDGKTIAVGEGNSGIWYIRQSSAGDRSFSFGLSTDTPTPSSYLP